MYTLLSHLTEEIMVRDPHSNQVCVRVKFVIELLRPVKHQGNLDHDDVNDNDIGKDSHLARQQLLYHLSCHRHFRPLVDILNLCYTNRDGLLGISSLKEY